MGENTQGRFPVVIGVDFSEASAYAIQEAAQLSHVVRRIELNFVHVIAAPADLHDARMIEALSERLNRTLVKVEHFVRDVLFVFGAPVGDGQELAFHLRVGVPAQEIHQVAVDTDAEMIVVGKDEEQSGLMRLFHRTTVDNLLRIAHVPVVVARQKDFRGLERSAAPDPARPGQDLLESGVTTYSYDYSGSRTPHVSGLI